MTTYPLTSKENSRRIRVAIRRVFLDIWDPIGINDSPHAQNEYDAYIGRAFELLWAKASDEELNDYLVWIVGQMGMDGSRSSHAHVIRALRAIDLHEQAQSTGLA
jgi:hypothetical protein